MVFDPIKSEKLKSILRTSDVRRLTRLTLWKRLLDQSGTATEHGLCVKLLRDSWR